MVIYHVYFECFKGLDKWLSVMHTDDHDGVISHIHKIFYNDACTLLYPILNTTIYHVVRIRVHTIFVSKRSVDFS